MTDTNDTERADRTPTTPPPPEDPTVLALSRIEGTLDELKALAVAQAQRTERFMAIAEKCFDECFVAHQSSEEIARSMGELAHRIGKVENNQRQTILPPAGGDG